MLNLKFTKMHSLGTDIVVINALEQNFTVNPKKMGQWSHRQFGIGFDQLVVIEKPTLPECDFKYRVFDVTINEIENSDAAARCFMQYILEKNLTTKDEVSLEIAQAKIKLKQNDNNQTVIDMGIPNFNPIQIPMMKKNEALTYPIEVDKISYEISCMNLGTPQAVILMDDIILQPLEELANEIMSLPIFPKKINVNFMQHVSDFEISIRSFEKNQGEVLANGTGACASTITAIRRGILTEQPVTVYTRGGIFQTSWAENEAVIISGNAVIIYEGEL